MSQALALDYAYRYPFPSRLVGEGNGRRLSLATSGGAEPNPYFFRGRLVEPKLVASLMLLLSEVSRTRYYTPQSHASAGYLLSPFADPVVASGGERLRLEAFSVCCGVYGRIDMLPDSVDGDWVGKGTTNVDFNVPMRDVLSSVGELEDVWLNVGADQLEIERAGEKTVEKKVSLPDRWLKGFVEVQAYQSRMKPFMEISGQQAHEFLHSISDPDQGGKGQINYIVPMGKGIRLTRREAYKSIAVGAPGRLKTAERLAKHADSVRIFSEPNGASAWQFNFTDMRFTLIVTADASRGFSGEGQVLNQLAQAKRSDALNAVRSSLQWQARIEASAFAQQLKLDTDSVQRALAILGARGLVGYDLEEGAYYHRELPFNLASVEETQPRLKSAKRLAQTDSVRIVRREGRLVEAYTPGENGDHFVYLDGTKEKCTCPWFVRHAGERGPCRHVLAVKLKIEEEDSGSN